MKKQPILQLKLLLLFVLMAFTTLTEVSAKNLIDTPTPVSPTVLDTMVTNDDGSFTMTAPAPNAYLYVRASKTKYKGTLSRDLFSGELLTVHIRAKSSSTNSYIKSSQLNIPRTRFAQVDEYQDFVFNLRVKDNVTNDAYIGLYTVASGESITVESVQILESKSLMATNTPLLPRTAGTMVTNDDGSLTMTAPTDYSYLYLRASKTRYKGALLRDLVAGEQLSVKIRAKSSSMNSYIRSSQLNIPKTRFAQADTYQDFVFNVTVSDDVNKNAYIGLYTTDIGESITVEKVEILTNNSCVSGTEFPIGEWMTDYSHYDPEFGMGLEYDYYQMGLDYDYYQDIPVPENFSGGLVILTFLGEMYDGVSPTDHSDFHITIGNTVKHFGHVDMPYRDGQQMPSVTREYYIEPDAITDGHIRISVGLINRDAGYYVLRPEMSLTCK